MNSKKISDFIQRIRIETAWDHLIHPKGRFPRARAQMAVEAFGEANGDANMAGSLRRLLVECMNDEHISYRTFFTITLFLRSANARVGGAFADCLASMHAEKTASRYPSEDVLWNKFLLHLAQRKRR